MVFFKVGSCSFSAFSNRVSSERSYLITKLQETLPFHPYHHGFFIQYPSLSEIIFINFILYHLSSYYHDLFINNFQHIHKEHSILICYVIFIDHKNIPLTKKGQTDRAVNLATVHINGKNSHTICMHTTHILQTIFKA